MRIDKVYTKGGDHGETSLIGGDRVSKADPRLECYGTVDELNATLGLVRTALAASAAGAHLTPIIHRVQNELFNLGCELATPDLDQRAKMPRIEARHVEALERDIDAVNDDLPALKSFVLPGGGAASAAFLRIASGAATDPQDDARLRGALRVYCERDTLALVELHRVLRTRSDV
jgi:cob(I)alamin adenosyltransferase